MNDSIERVLNKWNGERRPSENDNREAIWAIRPRWSTPYFLLFTLQVVLGTGIATYDGISSATPEIWIQAYFDIILRTGQVGIAAAIITFTLVELLGSIMLMSEWIRQNLVEPAKERNREQGRAEVRAQVRAEMKDWDRRRQASERRGETFHEPPPYLENGSSDNGH